MSAPEADPAEPVPEEVMRRVAREEARAVYDEHTVTGPDGQEWSFNKLVERIGELEGGIGRRTYIKAAMALGYIAMGTAGGTAIMQVMSQPARADAFGESGTQADPLTKLWAHAIGAGDGADAIGLDDAVTFDHEAISTSTTIGNVTYVYLDSGVASFTATIPAALEARGGLVVFIDEADNLSSNSVDIASTNWTVDGVNNSTMDADQAVYALRANPNQSDWTSRIFTERVNARELVTEKATIDGETFIAAERNTAASSISANTWTAIADTENDDNNNEQDASFNINPDKSGWYDIEAHIWASTVTAGDELQLAIRDVDAGAYVLYGASGNYTTGTEAYLELNSKVQLTAGTNYQVQAIDFDNTWTLSGSPELTNYTVTWSPIQLP